MLYQSLALLAVTLASVSAVPAKIAKHHVIHNPHGNIKIIFSDQKIKLGTISIDKIVKSLATACNTQGQCDTSPIDIKGEGIPEGFNLPVSDGITLTVNPSGSYPTWIHNDLIDTLSAAVKAVAICKDVSHTEGCPNPMAYCPSEQPQTENECTVPQYWGVNYQPADLARDAAPPFIGADMAVKMDDDGFCDTFTTSMGAVAGAVNGAAGGIFSLIGLFCK